MSNDVLAVAVIALPAPGREVTLTRVVYPPRYPHSTEGDQIKLHKDLMHSARPS